MSATALDTAWVGVITNPHSRKNRKNPNRARELERLVRSHGIVRETRSTDDIDAVVREFRELGIRYWISDGGDGCLHWMLNKAGEVLGEGIDDISKVVPFAVPANGGTIDFIARKIGIHGRVEEIVQRLVSRIGARPPDAVLLPSLRLRISRRDDAGQTRTVERLAFSGAIAGCSSRFFDLLYAPPERSPAIIAGIIARLVLAACGKSCGAQGLMPRRWQQDLDTLFRPHALQVRVDGQRLPSDQFTTINASALSINLGNILRLFPCAGPGRLHVLAGASDTLETARNVPRLMTGHRVLGRGIHFDGAARVLEIEAHGEPLRPVFDGELFEGVTALRVELGPEVRFAKV